MTSTHERDSASEPASALPVTHQSFLCCTRHHSLVLRRYTYLSAASLWPGPSAPLHSPSLFNLEALLVGPGSLSPTPCWGPADMLQLALAAAVGAVSRGGRVLVPVIAGEGERAHTGSKQRTKTSSYC